MKNLKKQLASLILKGYDHWDKLSQGDKLMLMASFQRECNKHRINKAYGEKRIYLVERKLKRLFAFYFLEEA